MVILPHQSIVNKQR